MTPQSLNVTSRSCSCCPCCPLIAEAHQIFAIVGPAQGQERLDHDLHGDGPPGIDGQTDDDPVIVLVGGKHTDVQDLFKRLLD